MPKQTDQKAPETNYMSKQISFPYREILAVLTQEDLRSRPNTILSFIQAEFLRRHPDGLFFEPDSPSLPAVTKIFQG